MVVWSFAVAACLVGAQTAAVPSASTGRAGELLKLGASLEARNDLVGAPRPTSGPSVPHPMMPSPMTSWGSLSAGLDG